MSNWRNNVCPKCGDADHIDVAATVWVRLTEDGSDTEPTGLGDHEYDDECNAVCANCNYHGPLGTFTPST